MTMSSSSNQGATPIHLTVMMNRACQFFSAPHHPQIDLMSSTQSPPALPLLPAKKQNKDPILSIQSSIPQSCLLMPAQLALNAPSDSPSYIVAVQQTMLKSF